MRRTRWLAILVRIGSTIAALFLPIAVVTYPSGQSDKVGAGILLLLPLIITFWLLSLIFNLLDDFLGGRIDDLPVFATIMGREIPQDIPGLGIITLIIVVYLAGLLGSSVLGRRFFTVGQNLLLSVPVVRTIYFATKQLVESLSGSKSTG